jgi:ribosomal-protein-alanine N-acetyltransferase
MSVEIREAGTADAESIARLHGECFPDNWDKESFRSLLTRPGCFALIAGSEAFILVQLAGGEAEIQSLGTRSAARRGGFARSLVEYAAKESFRRGARAMFLEVADDNGAALALYRGMGFAEVGKRRGYYPRGKEKPAADALILRNSLPFA